MKNVEVQLKGDLLIIGKDPRLVVNLKSQENYIETGSRKIPYRKKIQFSRDLLEGKRQNVFQTAVSYYYQQACQVASEQDSPGEGEGRAFIDNNRVYQIYSNQGANYL